MPDTQMTLLERAKLALRVSTDKFNTDIQDLIDAAVADLQVTDIFNADPDDVLIRRAVITFCRMHFGIPEPAEYNRLKQSYDEQKAQLSMHTGYTNWGDQSEE